MSKKQVEIFCINCKNKIKQIREIEESGDNFECSKCALIFNKNFQQIEVFGESDLGESPFPWHSQIKSEPVFSCVYCTEDLKRRNPTEFYCKRCKEDFEINFS